MLTGAPMTGCMQLAPNSVVCGRMPDFDRQQLRVQRGFRPLT